jgi:hypothetical protein
VCAVENKVDSGERINQLKKYRDILKQEYPDCRKILIYLTPEGDVASEKDWRIYSYSKLVEIIDSLCASYKSTLGTDIYTLITHYSTLLRRHIVSDSDVAELCRKIYIKHRQALDLIFEHRPDLQSEMADKLTDLATQYIASHKIYVKRYSKRYIGFGSSNWKDKKLPLTFHFENNSTYLLIRLLICPDEDKSIREKIYQLSKDNPTILKKSRWGEKWITIYQKQILNQKDYDDADVEKLMKKVQEFWDKFIQNEFLDIENIYANINKLMPEGFYVHPKV